MASPNLATTVNRVSTGAELLKAPSYKWDEALLYGCFSLLLFGPLAFGAVESWAIFILQCGAALLLLGWAAQQFLARQVTVSWNPLFSPALAFAAFVAVQLLFGRSAYRHDTVGAAKLYLAYGILVFLVVQCLQKTAQVKRLSWILAGYGTGMALFALLQSLSSTGKLYWLRTPRSGGWVYGPYVNHNHYAGLMEMLFPIALVAALTHHVKGKWKAIPAGAAVLMTSTIFLSGSRGGMVAFLVQMILLGALIGNQKNRRTALIAGVVLTVVACLMLWVGGEALVSRVASIHSEARTELGGGLRLSIDRDGLKMFAKHPILGWGLGTFPTVYPQFRSFFTDKFVNQAHDDYLQLLVETGLLGFGVMIWFVIRLYRQALRKLGDWTLDYNGAVALAALLGCTGILVHSFVDFNLQVPANALMFYVLCAIAAAPTNFTAPRRVRRRHRPLEFQPIGTPPENTTSEN